MALVMAERVATVGHLGRRAHHEDLALDTVVAQQPLDEESVVAGGVPLVEDGDDLVDGARHVGGVMSAASCQ